MQKNKGCVVLCIPVQQFAFEVNNNDRNVDEVSALEVLRSMSRLQLKKNLHVCVSFTGMIQLCACMISIAV